MAEKNLTPERSNEGFERFRSVRVKEALKSLSSLGSSYVFERAKGYWGNCSEEASELFMSKKGVAARKDRNSLSDGGRPIEDAWSRLWDDFDANSIIDRAGELASDFNPIQEYFVYYFTPFKTYDCSRFFFKISNCLTALGELGYVGSVDPDRDRYEGIVLSLAGVENDGDHSFASSGKDKALQVLEERMGEIIDPKVMEGRQVVNDNFGSDLRSGKRLGRLTPKQELYDQIQNIKLLNEGVTFGSVGAVPHSVKDFDKLFNEHAFTPEEFRELGYLWTLRYLLEDEPLYEEVIYKQKGIA